MGNTLGNTDFTSEKVLFVTQLPSFAPSLTHEAFEIMSVARALGNTSVSDEKTRYPLPKGVGLQHVSASDRLNETEPLEERSICLDPPIRAHAIERCGWCGLSVRRHGPEALARCEAALRAALERRRTGPTRVRDVIR